MNVPDIQQLPWKMRGPVAPLTQGETLLRASQQHRIVYVPMIFVYAVLLVTFVGIFLFLWRWDLPYMPQVGFFATLIVVLLVHHWFFYSILSNDSSTIILTNKRLLYLTNKFWVDTTMHDIALNQIKAVEVYKHGLLQNLFNYGDMWIDTGGSEGSEKKQIITYVPAPHEWAHDIARITELR